MAALLMLAPSGCFKVKHLGDNTTKAFDRIFALQTRATSHTARWQLKEMEAELAQPAIEVMVTPPKKTSSETRTVLLH